MVTIGKVDFASVHFVSNSHKKACWWNEFTTLEGNAFEEKMFTDNDGPKTRACYGRMTENALNNLILMVINASYLIYEHRLKAKRINEP